MASLRLEPIVVICRAFDKDNNFIGLTDSMGHPVEAVPGGGVSLAAFNALTATVTTQGSTITAQEAEITAVEGDIVTIDSTLVTVQADIDAIEAELAVGVASDDTIPSTNGNGTTDNATAFNAAISPTGTFFGAGKTRARVPVGGSYKLGALVDLHPSISLKQDARGGVLFVPGDNLPATNAQGGEAALIRIVRDSPGSSSFLAWAAVHSGFNIDFRGTTQANAVHGIRIPNPNPSLNSHDPDPDYAGNKDYSAGRIECVEIWGASGSGLSVESGNGRLDIDSSRFINSGENGADLGGNDVVLHGHWAAGGSGLFGIKVGIAAGFFATTGNMWGSSPNRSLTCGAMWINQRKMFAVGYSEYNDWLRMDGGGAYRGGVVSYNVFAQYGANFVSDGVAIDVTSGGPDSRLQANAGIVEYQSLNLNNFHVRTDKVTFATPANVGGDLAGNAGTAPAYLYDIGGGGSQPAMVNILEGYCTAPNIKPWSGNKATGTVTIATPGVWSSTAHGMQNGNRVSLSTTGALPTGLAVNTIYYLVGVAANTFQLAATWGGAAIATTGSQSGVHTWYNQSASPYNVHNGATGNYAYQDAYRGLFRVGCQGATHSHIALGIGENDDINPFYAVEIGDRTLPSNIPFRNGAYGMWEFTNAVQYSSGAFDGRVLTNGLTRPIKAGQIVQRLSVAGGGIAAAGIQLPTDLNASQLLEVFITGGPITALTWTTSPTASAFNANTPTPPTSTTGYLHIQFWYDHTTNTWYTLSNNFDTAGSPVLIQVACSDETTALTTGTAKVTFRAPYAFTLTSVRASVTTAATGGTLLTVDVNESGTSVLSTKLTFDASEKTTRTAATPAVISDSAIADDAEITVDIDAIGSTIAGAGLKITLVGTKL